MSRHITALWVSCLALAGLLASCSGNAGSPIQDNLDADYVTENPPSYDSAEAQDIPAGVPDPMAPEADGDKGASYTPGAACMVGAGLSFPSVLNYGWKGGSVTEGAAPDWVKLNGTAAAGSAWIIYGYKELAAGRLQQLRIWGAGKGMSAYVYNWRTSAWDFFGTYDLNLGAVTLPIAIQHAPNGMSYVMLKGPAMDSVRIDKTRTNVF